MSQASSSVDRDPIDRLAESFLARFRAGERPSIEEYAAKYPELAEAIRGLLAALVQLEENLAPNEAAARSRDQPFAPDPRSAQVPRHLGDYLIIREVGRGGMGVVYEAVQQSLGRHVALKLLPAGNPANGTQIERFRLEARAAARLHHTNIVPIFGVGEHDGLRYYVMQFIQGLGLDQVLEELKRLQDGPGDPLGGRRDARDEPRVSLRDISTTDLAKSLLTGRFVLAMEREGDGPKGVEPGSLTSLAPAAPVNPLNQSQTDDTFSLRSSSTMLPGVAGAERSGKKRPTYWQSVARIGVQVAEALEHAHKQGVLHRDVKPSNLLLDTRGTVWVTDFGLAKVEDQPNLTNTGDILGTLRYMPPEAFDGRADRRGDIYSLGLTLYELLAMRPAFEEKERNQLIKKVTTDEPPRLERLNREIPRDLVTIVHKAIDRETDRRYATAGELADDLRRFLADEPIQARRISTTEWCWRWCRRNPIVAGLTTALVLAFIIGFAGVTWKWREADAQKDLAQAAEFSEKVQRGIAVEKASRAIAEADRSRRILYTSDMGLAQQAWEAGDTGRARALLERQLPQAGQEDLRGFEWRYLWSLCRDGSRTTLRGHEGDITALVFSPDGKTLATSSYDGTVRLWDVATQRHVKLLGTMVTSMAFTPDGKTLALAGDRNKVVYLWDVVARSGRGTLPHRMGIEALAFSRDGKLLATCGWDESIRIWDVVTRKQVDTLAGHTGGLKCVAFSQDGKTLASGGRDTTVRLWDVATWQSLQTLRGHTDWVRSLSFSADGKTLASASDDTTVRLWDVATRKPFKTLRGHRTTLTSVAFSPDGKTFATGGGEGTIRLWDSVTKEVTTMLRGHTAPITAVAFAPDGRSLASGSRSGAVKLWDVAAGTDPNILTGHRAWLSSLVISPDGKTLAVSDADEHDNTVKLWDMATRQLVGILRGHRHAVWCVAFAPDGRTLATGSRDKTVQLWDVAKKSHVREFQQDEGVVSVAFSPDGKVLTATHVWNTIMVRDLASGKPLASVGPAYKVWFSPDGTLLASSGSGNTVWLWDVATWQKAFPLEGSTAEILGMAFSPDGRTLATRDGSGSLWVWDLVNRRAIGSSRGHTPTIPPSFGGCVTFSPDGRRLATSGGDCTVKLWDAGLLQEIVTLTGHDAPVYGIAFTPDGNTLATASGDTTVRLWHAPPLDAIAREPAEAPILPPIETIELFRLQQLGTAKATMAMEGDSHRIDVTAVDGTDWHAQVIKLFDQPQEGAKYRLRFRARADAERNFVLIAQAIQPKWHSIGLMEQVPLSREWRTYEYEFQVSDVGADHTVVFNVGDRKGTVWIADYSLTKAGM